MQKKYLILLIAVFIPLVAGSAFFFWLKSGAKKQEEVLPKKTTRKVSRINQLALERRPFVQLIPHPDPGRCDGISLLIDNLENNETLAEYELEYMAGPLIQGVFGRRDFTELSKHKPLELGSCSKGKCKCDTKIAGGSLTLRFTADEEYTLKGDFSYQNIGEAEGLITSRDAKLSLKVNKALPSTTTVIVASTLGLPAEVEGEVVSGPYGIFVPESVVPRGQMELSIQTKEENVSLLLWNGTSWQKLEVEVENGKVTTETSELGVVILTKEVSE